MTHTIEPDNHSFQALLQKYHRLALSEHDKGERFERLMQGYLRTDPEYSGVLKDVWMWEDFPFRKDFGGKDTGIDLVARTFAGDYWAIQCKCYQEDTVIDKPAVDSFLATSGRTFLNEQGETTAFAHRLWIATTGKWGANAEETIRNQTPPVSRIDISHLQSAPVDWAKLDKGIYGEAARSKRKTPLPHQSEAAGYAADYFSASDRGKLIMACGTGKTYTSLQIAENLTGGKGYVLFFAPSIALIGQTLREWTADAKEPINAICICSDPDVSKQKKKNEDDLSSYSIVDLALPVSTRPDHIIHQFYRYREHNKGGMTPGAVAPIEFIPIGKRAQARMTVVFSTYQSIDVIAKAQKDLLKHGFPEFDLIICDEAHPTTGVTLAGAEESEFVKVHDDKFIRAKKRLYMTATPRLYSDDTKSKAARNTTRNSARWTTRKNTARKSTASVSAAPLRKIYCRITKSSFSPSAKPIYPPHCRVPSPAKQTKSAPTMPQNLSAASTRFQNKSSVMEASSAAPTHS
jgi:predicted helicase